MVLIRISHNSMRSLRIGRHAVFEKAHCRRFEFIQEDDAAMQFFRIPTSRAVSFLVQFSPNMRAILILFVTLLHLIGAAQSPSSVIEPVRFDADLLERLIKKGVDSVRLKRKAMTLQADTALQLAANHQALYILKTGKLTHTQSRNKTMRTVMQRIRAFGGRGSYVAENALYCYVTIPIRNTIGKTVTLTTYQEAADEVVRMWVRSKGHYANMINRRFTHTGVAVAYDVARKRVIAVQVFSDGSSGVTSTLGLISQLGT